MPKRSERTMKKKKVRPISGKAKTIFVKGKTGKHKCALCKGILHGTPHGKVSSEVRKMSKSERRPDVLFAGTLCNKCRKEAVEEAAKVKIGIKKTIDIDIEKRKYVQELLTKIEV